MAWNLHWQCQFQSFNGTQYAVNIYERGYDGNVIQLEGAENPFTTREQNDDDIFTPIRQQTGYLRVIDDDGTLMESLIPANNTERLVQLWRGNYNSGGFIPRVICWQGFIQAQAYTQPWDGNAYVLELPVKSLLGALEDVSIDETFASAEKNVAALIIAAFDNFGLLADNDLGNLVITADVSDALNTLLKPVIQMSVFFDSEIVNDEGDSYEQLVGMSYYDALSAVMKLYGLQLREDGTKIYMNQFDGLNVRVWSIGWGYLTYIAGGSSIVATPTTLPSVDMLTALTFKGADNIAGYVQGARSAKVTVVFNDIDGTMCELPRTTEDASEVYSVDYIFRGNVYVQPHSPRINNNETFTYSEYQQVGQSGSNRIGSSNYTNCLNNSVIMRPLYDPHYSSSDHLHTGSFPCRWSYKREPSQSPRLANGLFVNQQYLEANWSFTPGYCYSLESSLSYQYSEGFLNVNMICHNFMRGQLAGDNDKLYFGEFTNIWGTKPQTKLYCILTWGDKEWNGTQWVTHSGNYNPFTIDFDGASVKTNKTESMFTEENEGWFIPITDDMVGKVKFYILDVVSCEDELGYADAHSRIITDLTVTYIREYGITVSERSSNTYLQKILLSGFSEEKRIDLTVGTYNNNKDSTSFLKQDSTTYIETFGYDSGSGLINQRPELHLLDRMVSQFGEVRRTFTGIVQRGVELMQTRYSYRGRVYFGIKEQTNWSDDKETIKFIEV